MNKLIWTVTALTLLTAAPALADIQSFDPHAGYIISTETNGVVQCQTDMPGDNWFSPEFRKLRSVRGSCKSLTTGHGVAYQEGWRVNVRPPYDRILDVECFGDNSEAPTSGFTCIIAH
jgi:hypothetical protein